MGVVILAMVFTGLIFVIGGFLAGLFALADLGETQKENIKDGGR